MHSREFLQLNNAYTVFYIWFGVGEKCPKVQEEALKALAAQFQIPMVAG